MSFLARKNVFAVVGATTNTEKYGYNVMKNLLNSGYKIFPINPKYEEIENIKCYTTLKDIPFKIDVVVTVVPSEITEKTVKEMSKIGITNIWMQPGSESNNAIRLCKEKNIECIHNTCIMLQAKE